jgi:hypothetical protein
MRVNNPPNNDFQQYRIERVIEKKYTRRAWNCQLDRVAFNNSGAPSSTTKEAAHREIVFGDPTKRWRKFDANNTQERKGGGSKDYTTFATAHVDKSKS